MASTSNGSVNLVDEFEDSFLSIMQVLTKEEENFNTMEKDETRVDIQQCTMKFVELSKQLETFFIQKRFLLSTMKPELYVKEEIADLKLELQRKDDLLKRHYEKIGLWKTLLTDIQGWSKPASSDSSAVYQGRPPACSSTIGLSHSHPSPPVMGASPVQQQQTQPSPQRSPQMPPVGMGIMSSSGGAPMMSPQQQQVMFMQQQVMGPRMSSFAPGQAPPPNVLLPGAGMLAGPLAFLEKTTSNIGMTDGRR